MARNTATATRVRKTTPKKSSKARKNSKQINSTAARPVRGVARTAARELARSASRLISGRRVYFFGSGKAEGGRGDKQLLGGKGANLADMTAAGLPVPPGFTITTEVCAEYYESGQKLPAALMAEVETNLRKVEKAAAKKFGDAANPLLVSVRSGAAASMPGMMDTILNLGMNDEVAEAMARQTNNPRFAFDSYRRLINMFGDVVMGVDHHHFEQKLSAMKDLRGVENDTDLSADDLRKLAEQYKQVYREHVGSPFPQDPMQQLERAIEAVFRSWNTERAIKYRQLNDITGLKGTAVNVQTMVFGNMGNDSATGVAFTRNPSTGENKFYGEYLVNAQGEDVVAGIRTPKDVAEMKKEMPQSYRELVEVRGKLEDRYRDMQDFEFTIEQGKLYMLQTRGGKRTGVAALRVAIEMLREGLIDEKKAVQMVSPEHLDQLLHPMFVPAEREKARVLSKGLNASPGAAVGKIAFTADEAEERVGRGENVILVRRETEPADIGGMHVAEGILTSTGGMTSHAAVVARGMGTPCICGASEVHIDAEARKVKIKDMVFGADDFLSIDGTTGEVLEGQVPTQEPEPDKNFKKLMTLVDMFRRLNIRTNADTPEDAQRAREYGAEGIGLCRTEHMFFAPDRIGPMRQMILSNTQQGREAALRKLEPFQKRDFIGIFRAMAGLPVTIRLLDPPLHEFLPQNERDQRELANEMGLSFDEVRRRVAELHEMNPMLGHRGCRLAVTYPEILRMQVRAIIEAAIEVGSAAVPEIMIPLVGFSKELVFLKEHLYDEVEKVFREKARRIKYLVGTMIEVPRAALVADEIAREAEFFSFGTNDLTQMAMGFSRDDAGRFLGEYVGKGILESDPFQTLDTTGVGQLIEMSCRKGRAARPNLKLGICGEHGGDPRSVHFCHQVGLDYVSCSPFRVPIARLAAAHAALRE